jgi:hypothetical protein
VPCSLPSIGVRSWGARRPVVRATFTVQRPVGGGGGSDESENRDRCPRSLPFAHGPIILSHWVEIDLGAPFLGRMERERSALNLVQFKVQCEFHHQQ